MKLKKIYLELIKDIIIIFLYFIFSLIFNKFYDYKELIIIFLISKIFYRLLIQELFNNNIIKLFTSLKL